MIHNISLLQAATHPLIRAWPEDTLGDVYEKLCRHNAVVVADQTGQFQGIITRKDAVREMLRNPNSWPELPVSEVMTKEVLYVPNHVSLAEAAQIMLDSDIHQLVVVGPPEGGKIAIGIVTLQDVVKNARPPLS